MNPLTKGRKSTSMRQLHDLCPTLETRRVRAFSFGTPSISGVLMSRRLPSADELRALFSYNPESGQLLRADGSDPTFRNKHNYLRVTVGGLTIAVHRVAWVMMTGKYPEETVDHKDLDTINNRWNNLREATSAQQQANRGLLKKNKTGFRGVRERWGRFRAEVVFDKKTHYLGTFDTPEEAADVVQKVREARWGEFARAA